MISFKGRESKRGRIYKMSRNIERLYREGKCRDCKVLVTRMDFAKILGKFTKVKIQYESNKSPKTKKSVESNASNSNSRLKSNENGMVLVRRNTYKQHPAKVLQTPKALKIPIDVQTSKSSQITKAMQTPKTTNNILKENNCLKKDQVIVKEINYDYGKKTLNSNFKQYGIVFTVPNISNNNNQEIKTKISLIDLLPNLNKSLLPSEEWCIDYFPKNEEPKDDKVYDRIAAELEDLMYNEKPIEKSKSDVPESKVEEFPSIMDILNDNTSENTLKENELSSEQFKNNLESSDVEAILLGKSKSENKDAEPIPMEVDSTDVSKLIEDMDQLNNIADSKSKVLNEEAPTKSEEANTAEEVDNPHSPSILDEALQKGIEEHLPNENLPKDDTPVNNNVAECKGNENNETISDNNVEQIKKDVNHTEEVSISKNNDQTDKSISIFNCVSVTHVIFKKYINGKCYKSVKCPKNLKYSIELEGKSVEFIGAPKYISSLEDLQVLLQIVDESELDSLYVLH
ncbi:unnamed protein product [Parnassius mnemosyne]|uniref:Uncharacterized protein n=1 Tax=Parnassius mnemosyne TaxID=213953 RepID=A0AAV1KID4_9NEOP